ncbi:MAG: glycosyltransferase [Actinomycetota bacterium]
MNVRLDIVIPAHNEEARIGPTLASYRDAISDPEVRFLVALDGTVDSTGDVVRRHAFEDKRVELLDFPKLGKGGVLMETFRRCTGDLVAFVDADRATSPRELLRLVESVNEVDGAIASRRHPAAIVPVRPLARRLASAGFAFGIRRLFRLPYTDTQCGAKVLHRDVVERILPYLSSRDFLFDVDLLVVAKMLGYRIVEVPTIWIDQEGSRVHPVGDARRMAASALRLWIHHKVLPPGSPGNGRSRDFKSSNGRSTIGSPRRGADVALISPYPLPGRHSGSSGVATYARDLTQHLSEKGANVEVIAPQEAGAPAVAYDEGIRVTRPFRLGPRALSDAARAAVRTGAPVVHLQHELFLYGGASSAASFAPAMAHLKRAGARRVVTMHQVIDPSSIDAAFVRMHRTRVPARAARAALSGVQTSLNRLSDAVIVHERHFQEIIPGSVVVPHGIQIASPTDRSVARAQLGWDDRFTVLCFGFIAPYKGLEFALEAAHLAGRDVHLVVAGGEHPRLAGRDPYAADLVERWGHAAAFHGFVPDQDVAAMFSAADLALFPYPKPHASSGALALALAHGTPFLVSGELGRCVDAPPSTIAPLEPESLSRRLEDLAGSREALAELKQSCDAMGRDRSWPDVALRHLDLYRSL